MQFHFWRGLRAAYLFVGFACLVGSSVGEARADAKNELTDMSGKSVPLQKVIRKERARGPIYIAVPVAYVFGLGSANSPTYCSPTVRASNSSNLPIEELIVGIDFHTKAGPAGGSISRFANIKVGHQDAHYFYQLTVSHCGGIEGAVTVVRCQYTSGEDCAKDVDVINYGTIPLFKKNR